MRPTTPHIGRWDIKQNLLWNCISERREPLFRKFYIFLNLRSVEPFGDVDDADAFHLTLGVLRAGDDHFRIGVLDGEQGGDFPLQRFGAGNIVTYLDIGLYAFFDSDEIDFFFAELPDVDFVTAAQQFDGDEIFIEMPVIGVFRADRGVTEREVRKVVFFIRFQIALALDVVPLEGVEQKAAAEIFDISAARLIVRLIGVGGERVCDLADRRLAADIVHQKIGDHVQQICVFDFELGDDVFRDGRADDARKVFPCVCLIFVEIRARHPALDHIAVERRLDIVFGIIQEIFAEGEGKHCDLKDAAAEQGGEVAGKEEGVGADQIDIEALLLVQAVDDGLKPVAKLHLIDEEVICNAFPIAFVDIAVESVPRFQSLKLFEIELDADDVLGRAVFFKQSNKSVHQL